jgi:hypothetical protein
VSTASVDPRRAIWVPEFEVSYREVDGQPWPIVVVVKVETNLLDERRYVDSRMFDANVVPHEEADIWEAPSR